MMTSRERILTAARREKPDRIPLDLWCTGEVQDRLRAHFGVGTEKELGAKLHLDKIVGVSPRYVGPPERALPDGTKVDNQQALPYGTVDDVRREVRDCMTHLGAGGGYILAPCHNIQPVTPVENVIAMYETAWTEGWY